MKLLEVQFLKPIRVGDKTFDRYAQSDALAITCADGFVRLETADAVTHVPVHRVHQMKVDDSAAAAREAKK